MFFSAVMAVIPSTFDVLFFKIKMKFLNFGVRNEPSHRLISYPNLKYIVGIWYHYEVYFKEFILLGSGNPHSAKSNHYRVKLQTLHCARTPTLLLFLGTLTRKKIIGTRIFIFFKGANITCYIKAF